MSKWDENKLRQIIFDCKSYAQCLRHLDLPLHGGNYNTLKRKIQEYKIDIDHFTHEPPEKLKGKGGTKIPLEEILVEDSSYSNTHHLKGRLMRSGALNEGCSRCGRLMWMGQKLSLHLDHINGVNNDHRLENLRLLCPNCHSLTPTYCGKNRRKEPNTCVDCEKEILQSSTRCLACHYKNIGADPSGSPQNTICSECGRSCSKGASRCRECHNPSENLKSYRPGRKFDPDPEELKKLVWKMPATKVGEHFGVSGRAIKKRCRKYGIKTPGRGYWAKKKAGKI